MFDVSFNGLFNGQDDELQKFFPLLAGNLGPISQLEHLHGSSL